MTYLDFVKNRIQDYDFGLPIYTVDLAKSISREFQVSAQTATAAVSAAVKRIIDTNLIPELRRFQKGIYYRTKSTVFGDVGIDTTALIKDKYLADGNGYETGLSLLNRLGLTTQVPRNVVLATNKAKGRMRRDEVLGVYISPPKVRITSQNKRYLQILDAIEAMKEAPIDADHPDTLIAEYIEKAGLDYGVLIDLAHKFYSKRTVVSLERIAAEDML